MSETKHTPGPWRTDAHGSIVCYPEGLTVGVLSKQLPDAELKANHSLIVAAPDLLDALKRILNPAPGVTKLPPWVYGIAGAAIAKAEGSTTPQEGRG